MEYTITEKQNLQSTRISEIIEAKDLTEAKRTATRKQAFHGTVLTIEQNNILLAYKDINGWTTV